MTRAIHLTPIRHNVWSELMPSKLCACCGLPFQPVPQVPDQTYCSEPACQRTRRQAWNRQKLANDPDYRDNKKRAQRDWMDRNPDYWRQYRADHPEYVETNRSHQRTKAPPLKPVVFAKKDELNRPQHLLAGIYRITPIQNEITAKQGFWTVELSPVCLDRDCKKKVCKGGACKDRM